MRREPGDFGAVGKVLERPTQHKAPKTGPADFVHDLELFAEMARLMRGP